MILYDNNFCVQQNIKLTFPFCCGSLILSNLILGFTYSVRLWLKILEILRFVWSITCKSEPYHFLAKKIIQLKDALRFCGGVNPGVSSFSVGLLVYSFIYFTGPSKT